MLDLKILMYRNADEIGKLQKIKADFDKEMLEALQQVKNLSNSNTALQQELDELRVAAQAMVDMVRYPRIMQRHHSPWQRSFGEFLNACCNTSKRPPNSTFPTCLG